MMGLYSRCAAFTRIEIGMAVRWLGMPRVHFLLKAKGEGNANLLEDNEDDFNREISLL